MSTGGTDIISCFAGQNPVLPVYRGEIQARNLAMGVECWNEDGESHSAVGVASAVWGCGLCTGEAVLDGDGELVCVKPFPSQPTHFWNDDDGIKYTKAYFSMYKGVYVHNIMIVCMCMPLYTAMYPVFCRRVGPWRFLQYQL